ncbi:MAG: hypothetical protein Q8J70_07775, partial [Thiobacillus sp.]|nr:hypothetical protein [Thiobacillus sp.]
SLTAQILKTLLPQLQPYLFSQPPTPPTPAPETAAAAATPEPPAPVVPRAPVKEKPDGATSQAAPPAKEPPTRGGFPEDLEPSVVVPVPVKPAAVQATPPAPVTPAP